MPYYKQKGITTIPYKDAPSGAINIEKWEPPFMPVNKGYGFIGIIAEDVDTGKLQCHYCGKWYEQLPTHILRHGHNGESYRKEYGLLSGTALKSKRIRLIHSATCQNSMKKGKMNIGSKFVKGSPTFTKGNKYAANKKGQKTAPEAANKHGACDLQIMTKIISLGKKLGKTPTLVDIKKEYGMGLVTVMHQRYGSYIKYCKDYLKMQPNWSAKNPKPEKIWKKELEETAINLNKKNISIADKKLGMIMQSRIIQRIYGSWKGFRTHIKKKYGINLSDNRGKR